MEGVAIPVYETSRPIISQYWLSIDNAFDHMELCVVLQAVK